MRYFVEIMRACLLKAADFADLGLHFAALLGFGVAILSSAPFGSGSGWHDL